MNGTDIIGDAVPTRAVKQCSSCGQGLPISAFARRPDSLDGLQAQCRPCRNEARRQRKQAVVVPTPATRVRSAHPTTAPRLTGVQYAQMLRQQQGRCACCSHEESWRDHDGEPMRLTLYGSATDQRILRGLICRRCSMLLVCAGDSPVILARAIAFLTQTVEAGPLLTATGVSR